MRLRVIAIVAAVSALAGTVLFAQGFRRFVWEPNVPYDGKFTFARLSYTVYGGRSGWEFDYPAMERHLMTMVREISELRPHQSGSNIHAMDDPELLRYPVAYLSEPGYWHPSESEVVGLRTYLQKGGFLIVDDFHYPNEWAVFAAAMRRVLPDGQIQRLDASHPIYNSFSRLIRSRFPTRGAAGRALSWASSLRSTRTTIRGAG